jgi:hypothetical protein
MKTSPRIDPKVLQADMLELINDNKHIGLNADEAGSLLAGRETYATYHEEYVRTWTLSMLEKLAGQGLIVLKGDRYFPAELAAAQ